MLIPNTVPLAQLPISQSPDGLRAKQILPLNSMGQRSKMKKLMIILKRWQSFPRVARSYSNLSCHPDPCYDADVHNWNEQLVGAPSFLENRPSSLVHADHDNRMDEVPEGCKAVYVGKCRRRYFISAEYLNHPVLSVLTVDKFRDGCSLACEVVLFEHLVWILENSDPESIHDSDSTLEEMAELYSCN